MALYLYDSRFNLKIPTTVKELASMGILTEGSIYSYKCKRKKVSKINKYIIDETTPQKEIKKLYCSETYKDETWADVEGYDYKYQVSNYGRIKRICKTKDIFLLPFKKHKLDYMCVKLKKNNKFSQVKVYKLVADAFLDNPNNETHVVHINGIKHDDRVCNLEYISKEQLGKVYGSDSKSTPIYKIDDMTFEILDTYKSGREAGKIDNLCYQSVFDVVNKKARLTINGSAYVSETEYEAFMDSIDEKRYMLFNAVTYEKNIGTIKELSDISQIGIHSLKYMYETGKCVNCNNIYMLDEKSKEFNKLYKSSCGPRELWRDIEIEGYSDYSISDYGRVKCKNNMLIPKIKNNTKYITLKDVNNNTKDFEVFKLVCLSFKKTIFRNQKVSYSDLDDYKVLYADNNYYNTKSTNMEIFKEEIISSLNPKEKEFKIALASKKRKVIKNTYDNIYVLAETLNVDTDYMHLCIKDNRRINNNFYMFEHDCKNFNYEG